MSEAPDVSNGPKPDGKPDQDKPDHAVPDGAKPDHAASDGGKPDDANSDGGKPPGRVPQRPLWIVAAMVTAALAWGVWGEWDRSAEASQTQQETQDFVPTVRVAVAKKEAGPVPFTLPGTVAAFEQATLYARATGYIAERHVDIGSRVKAGDLLIRISAPDLDQQLAQANAQLVQMQAALAQANAQAQQAASNENLANVTNGRTSVLAGLGWETKQNADNTRLGLAGSKASVGAAQAGIQVAEANLASQVATVRRLEQLTGYERVTAPFDGVIISRAVDVGDLVSADSNGTGNTLFALARDDVVRVEVSVPQSGAIGIHDGLPAVVHVAELPGRDFKGTVARSAVALAQSSRTMQSEVDVPNTDGTLRPGLYVTVDVAIPRTAPGVVIPSEAVMFNGEGLRTAVVGDDDTVHMRDVAIYRDYGTSVELRSGLDGGEKVVMDAPATLADGAKVKIEKDQPKPAG